MPLVGKSPSCNGHRLEGEDPTAEGVACGLSQPNCETTITIPVSRTTQVATRRMIASLELKVELLIWSSFAHDSSQHLYSLVTILKYHVSHLSGDILHQDE